MRLSLCLRDPACPICGAGTTQALCQACAPQYALEAGQYWPRHRLACWHLGLLQGRLKRLIYQAKFNKSPWASHQALALLTHALQQHKPHDRPTAITLVLLPSRGKALHWLHQACLYLHIGQGYSVVTLHWQRPTGVQRLQLNKRHRWLNMQHALLWPSDTPLPTGPVVIIDDITTTGATLYWAMQALRHRGYQQDINAVTLAKTPASQT